MGVSELLDTATRRAYVIKLRRTGMTYEEIANSAIEKFGSERLPNGYDERYAWKDIKRELERTRNEMAEDVEAVRQLELDRLDALFKSLWIRAAGPNSDYQAIDRALRIMDRRAKMLGLDAPAETINTNVDATQFVISGGDPDNL